jgi:hypothetical protein
MGKELKKGVVLQQWNVDSTFRTVNLFLCYKPICVHIVYMCMSNLNKL